MCAAYGDELARAGIDLHVVEHRVDGPGVGERRLDLLEPRRRNAVREETERVGVGRVRSSAR